MTGEPAVSVVVPVCDAEATLPELFERISATLEARRDAFEVLFVDDGSRDGSWQAISTLAEQSSAVTGLRLARNYGQAAALCAGFEAARGNLVVTIDADLDTYPEDIPLLLDALLDGADVANGARSARHWPRSMASNIVNGRARRMGLPYTDLGCGMVAMTAPVAKEVLNHGELRRGVKLKALLAALTPHFVEVPVRAGPGSPSRHRFGDLLSAALEIEVAFRRSTLLGAAGFGFVTSAAGLTLAVVGLALAVTDDGAAGLWLAGWSTIVGLLGLLIGIVATVSNLLLRALHHQSTAFFRVVENTAEPQFDDC